MLCIREHPALAIPKSEIVDSAGRPSQQQSLVDNWPEVSLSGKPLPWLLWRHWLLEIAAFFPPDSLPNLHRHVVSLQTAARQRDNATAQDSCDCSHPGQRGRTLILKPRTSSLLLRLTSPLPILYHARTLRPLHLPGSTPRQRTQTLTHTRCYYQSLLFFSLVPYSLQFLFPLNPKPKIRERKRFILSLIKFRLISRLKFCCHQLIPTQLKRLPAAAASASEHLRPKKLSVL